MVLWSVWWGLIFDASCVRPDSHLCFSQSLLTFLFQTSNCPWNFLCGAAGPEIAFHGHKCWAACFPWCRIRCGWFLDWTFHGWCLAPWLDGIPRHSFLQGCMSDVGWWFPCGWCCFGCCRGHLVFCCLSHGSRLDISSQWRSSCSSSHLCCHNSRCCPPRWLVGIPIRLSGRRSLSDVCRWFPCA